MGNPANIGKQTIAPLIHAGFQGLVPTFTDQKIGHTAFIQLKCCTCVKRQVLNVETKKKSLIYWQSQGTGRESHWECKRLSGHIDYRACVGKNALIIAIKTKPIIIAKKSKI